MKIIKYITSSVANQNSVIFSDLCLKTASSLINKTILTKVFVVHQKLFVLSSKSRGGSTSHYPIIILLDEKKFWIGPWLMSNEWFTSRPIPPKTIENQQATNRSFTGKYPLFDTVWHHPPPLFFRKSWSRPHCSRRTWSAMVAQGEKRDGSIRLYVQNLSLVSRPIN